MLSIGLMSGTSMDGVDAALLETDGSPYQLREGGHVSLEYPLIFKNVLKATEYVIREHQGQLTAVNANFLAGIAHYLREELCLPTPLCEKTLAEITHSFPNLASVIRASTEFHIQAVQKLLTKTALTAKQIDVVGYHGQTMLHRPLQKKSIILGDGQYLANATQITVVNDFRSRDMAEGGQGAPFAPIYHQALAIRENLIPIVVVNCGGIANITCIPSTEESDLVGFDTGPGNGLIDRLVRQVTQGAEAMDQDGRYGLQGTVDLAVLAALYEKAVLQNGKNYFTLAPPKSLDIGDLHLIPELKSLSLPDACATLAAFTADTIVQSSSKIIDTFSPKKWILAGGGWHNPVILRELRSRLTAKIGKNIHVLTADDAGWNTQALEAQLFAYLAVRSLQNKPLSFPNTTLVSRPMSGGCIYAPQNQKNGIDRSDD